MTTNEARILLDESVTAEVFKRGAERRGWELLKEYQATNDTNYELVYAATKDKKTTVNYVEDQFLMVRYALVRGPQNERVVSLVETTFDAYDDDEVIERADKDGDLQEMIDWLMSATALGEQIGRERLIKLIERRLEHDNAAIRRAALIAVSWLEWPELRKPVERLAKDPDPEVRADAERLADAYKLRDAGEM